MNRIQFWTLTGLSSLVVILLFTQILLVHAVNSGQQQMQAAQQIVGQGQASQGLMKQIAVRIFQESQKTNDQVLKDLLARQQITYNAGDTNAASDTSAPSANH